jgi:nucleoside-diphosphate-sugar epimerase
MSKNILILGNGFIGNNLYKYFVSRYNTTITSKQDIDVTDHNSVKNYLNNKKNRKEKLPIEDKRKYPDFHLSLAYLIILNIYRFF